MHHNRIEQPLDVILIGGGILSATLGTMLKVLAPELSLHIYEAASELAQENSHEWNNAGTGHAGICEFSYTPSRSRDGTIDVSQAVRIFEQFEQSKQFWSYAVEHGLLRNPEQWITPLPHISFVYGPAQVEFLRDRYQTMRKHHFFKEMEFTTDPETIRSWAPLLLEGRNDIRQLAASRMTGGTDINFGQLARKLLRWLDQQPDCDVQCHHFVQNLQRSEKGWKVTVRNLDSGESLVREARFVFIGAGGGSIPLLLKSGIPGSQGTGGFPVGGQWLVCNRPDIVARHHAKVYGQSLAKAPSMTSPHLDTRIFDGQKSLLFGPFAIGTSKFLQKKGHWADLFRSIKPGNLTTLLKAGFQSVPLVRYLLQQSTQTMQDRMEVLRLFFPDADERDWQLVQAGIRVQTIRQEKGKKGLIHYGTQIVTDPEKTLSALLGASPGASVSPHIALNIIRDCFPQHFTTSEWEQRMRAMIPSYDQDLTSPQNESCYRELQTASNRSLKLQ